MFSIAVSKSDFASNRTRFRMLFAEIDEKITSQAKQKKTAVFRRADIDISDFDKQNFEIDTKCSSELIKKIE